MAIQGVDTKCYILALFIRDDDERFLLGSGQFEFKDSQKQFEANAIQNDVVEVQGNDGYLLAGQVRRSGTQNFDGYVGDGTMAKTEVEENRRKFFAFYQKNHFYRVVYVFPDGTAIQRKRGFLVDDPTVQELYQQYPEYHVALNFEDVNYYTYSENEQGEEIYAEEAIIDLSVLRATGGLIWDEYGAVSDGFAWGGETTATGTEFQIQNELDLPAPVTDAKIYGDAEQQTYTGKNLVNIHGTLSERNVTTTISGENITVASNDSADTARVEIPVSYVANQQVTISFDATCNVYQPTTPNLAIVYMRVGSTSTTRITLPTSSGVTRHYEATFTPTVDGMSLWLYVKSSPVSGIASYQFRNIQIEAGSTATDYEPYVDGIPAPNPDYPQDIHVVTGEQTVSISDDNGNNHSYNINLGSTELCKLGNYQDYIYKSGDDWYVHKAIGKYTFTGSEGWGEQSNYNTDNRMLFGFNATNVISGDNIADRAGISNNFIFTQVQSPSIDVTGFYFNRSENYSKWIYVKIQRSLLPTENVTGFKNWLANNNMTVYYQKTPATDTQITDSTLIAQLNALGKMKLFVGENNVLVSASGTNLPGELTLTYYTTLDTTGSGYVWEEGGSGGPTMVEINSITNVYPIWKIFGPAVNPELSILTTNTTLTYNGTVASGQYLVIDMMNKTAKLNGTSVIGNVSGDWVNLRPGVNRVVYATDNSDTPSSIIEWQEVVG